MAVSDTKLRMLYLMKILLERTDEENIMSSEDLVSALRSYGMECRAQKRLQRHRDPDRIRTRHRACERR